MAGDHGIQTNKQQDRDRTKQNIEMSQTIKKQADKSKTTTKVEMKKRNRTQDKTLSPR